MWQLWLWCNSFHLVAISVADKEGACIAEDDADAEEEDIMVVKNDNRNTMYSQAIQHGW